MPIGWVFGGYSLGGISIHIYVDISRQVSGGAQTFEVNNLFTHFICDFFISLRGDFINSN